MSAPSHGLFSNRDVQARQWGNVKSRIKILAYSRRAKIVGHPLAALAVVNFIAFSIGSVYLGGDAINGFESAGHFFVCEHGHCTEVSSCAWHYSYWHAIAAIGGILLMFATMALFINTGDIEWK
jgi:hypothetical protein